MLFYIKIHFSLNIQLNDPLYFCLSFKTICLNNILCLNMLNLQMVFESIFEEHQKRKLNFFVYSCVCVCMLSNSSTLSAANIIITVRKELAVFMSDKF